MNINQDFYLSSMFMEQRIMNVKNKTLAQWKKFFSQELAHLYEKREIDSLFSLIFESFGWSRIDLLLKLDSDLSLDEKENLSSIIDALKEEYPIQYTLGSAHFDGLEIPVKPGVLIPRQETEELVEWAYNTIGRKSRILDVCTGSGCIALALKNRNTNLDVSAIEYSDNALDQAKNNAEVLDLDINFMQFNVLEGWHFDQMWDCIISNPPYIPNSDKVRMKKNVLDFEPEMALFVEDSEPLIFYKQIAEQGRKVLNKDGYLFFEIHEDLGFETKSLVEQLGYSNVELRQDLNGKDRMIKAQK